MKTLLHASVCLALTVTALQASPIWTSNRDSEYLLSSDKDLSFLSVGFNIESMEREIEIRNTGNILEQRVLEMNRYRGYLGCDVFDWLTIYGTAGGARAGIQGYTEDAEANAEYGAGFRLNFLDQIIADPLLIEDRIRLTATVQYTRSSMNFVRQYNWSETRSSVQLSIVNDIDGNPYFRPEALALNIGYVYSDLRGDYGIDEVHPGFATLGAEIFYSKRISFDGSIYFGNSNETRGMIAGFHMRF